MTNTTESLYENICRSQNELDMLPENYSLPTEASSKSDDLQLHFADGALDGIAIYHMGIPDQDSSLLEQALDMTATDLRRAHKLIGKWVTDGHALSVHNKIQKYITDHQQVLLPSQIYRLAVECALKGTHREEVKFGLILLTLLNTDTNEPLKNALRILALSDEFTLYVLQIAAHWTDSSREILHIAQKVRGWGRVHAVACLKPESQEIEDWLFSEGWNNTVMPDYSALECYHKGKMRQRLENSLTEKDFASACGLLQALLSEGPMPGISEVEDSEALLNAFLDCSAGQAASPHRQKVLQQIEVYAGEHELSEIAERIQTLL